ncbi:hypothetical protein [Photobacterium sp. TLY01]|uniref:hypothetical protein n=1 Tax=Photobacterium sp. TLY01 TaxID=2907534 RepID=UPI001F172FA9|nr:hypothetical protein [Photobacterium sp. TLY01]UIP27477.1 hypothetical protein LN341_12750 [Photobacterium sp. TLY01]
MFVLVYGSCNNQEIGCLFWFFGYQSEESGVFGCEVVTDILLLHYAASFAGCSDISQ